MKIGFIDYFLDEWHANNYPQWIRDASGGEMEVTCAWAMMDHPRGGRTTRQWCADMGIDQAFSIQEVIDRCDALVVLSPDNCEMHEELCQLPLRSGKPTYVDKTFAPDLDTARRIFAIAEESGTPCYSTSALRFAEEYKGITDVKAVCAWSPSNFEIYSIHLIEPIMMMMQGVPEKVMYLPGDKWYSLILVFADGRTATLSGFEAGSPFVMNITTGSGAKMIEVKSDFFRAFIENLVAFFRDSSHIVPHEETLRIMAVRGAGLKATQTPGEWVSVY